ncbi:MAG: hypothetical protein MUE50_00095 [Pirellulaceae bacterium]|jgi:hypothetical protein|nr:hypothetical protein [Pirellulaceae bacterium]
MVTKPQLVKELKAEIAQAGNLPAVTPADADAVVVLDASTGQAAKLLMSAIGSYVAAFGHADVGTPAAAANALLAGIGTSANPAATATANKNFIEIRAKTTATSGDNRLGYFRYEVGAAGGGECMRAFTALTAAAGTVRGAHVSLIPSGSGAVSGLGTAGSFTLHFGTAAFITGHVACIEANPYSDGTTAPPTEHGAIRVASGGNATGAAAFTNVLHVSPLAGQVGNKSAALMVCNADVTGDGGAAAGGLQVRVNGVQYWIPLYTL